MKIGHRIIGKGEPVYVIAEIGSNHDGDLEQAKRLIVAAADSEARAAKFQLFRGDKLYPGRDTPGAVPDWWLPILQETCWDMGIEFLCSVFCRETLDAYMQVDPLAIKIASPEAANLDLLRAASMTGLPLLVSTGAMDWPMLDRTAAALDGVEIVLLACTSAYPAPPAEMCLDTLQTIAGRYGASCGLSDHSLEPVIAPVMAVALGAQVIEKHLTLDRNSPGPDHSFALEPAEFRVMVDAIRQATLMLGDGVKRVQPSEDATDRRAA